jgi:hypothetical protein
VGRRAREAYDRCSLPGGLVPVKCSAVPPAPADRPGSRLPRSGRLRPQRPDLLESQAGLLAGAAAASEAAVLAESWELVVPAVQAEQPRCPRPARPARPSFRFLGVLTGSAWVLEAAADPIPVQRPGHGHRPEVADAAARAATAPDSAEPSATAPDSAADPAFAASAAVVPASAASVAQPPASAEPEDGSRIHSHARRRVAADGRRSRETAGLLSQWPGHLER